MVSHKLTKKAANLRLSPMQLTGSSSESVSKRLCSEAVAKAHSAAVQQHGHHSASTGAAELGRMGWWPGHNGSRVSDQVGD